MNPLNEIIVASLALNIDPRTLTADSVETQHRRMLGALPGKDDEGRAKLDEARQTLLNFLAAEAAEQAAAPPPVKARSGLPRMWLLIAGSVAVAVLVLWNLQSDAVPSLAYRPRPTILDSLFTFLHYAWLAVVIIFSVADRTAVSILLAFMAFAFAVRARLWLWKLLTDPIGLLRTYKPRKKSPALLALVLVMFAAVKANQWVYGGTLQDNARDLAASVRTHLFAPAPEMRPASQKLHFNQ